MNHSSANSVKQSYFNILALFLEGEKMETRLVKCLLKWGLQLKLTRQDIDDPEKKFEQLQFSQPSGRVERLEAIYHLVEMIYLDNVVEDVELEVASIYAEKLEFKSDTVSELFKSIATAAYDQNKPRNVHQEVMEFLKIHED